MEENQRAALASIVHGISRLDATSRSGFRDGGGRTTRVGYVNRNDQELRGGPLPSRDAEREFQPATLEIPLKSSFLELREGA